MTGNPLVDLFGDDPLTRGREVLHAALEAARDQDPTRLMRALAVLGESDLRAALLATATDLVPIIEDGEALIARRRGGGRLRRASRAAVEEWRRR